MGNNSSNLILSSSPSSESESSPLETFHDGQSNNVVDDVTKDDDSLVLTSPIVIDDDNDNNGHDNNFISTNKELVEEERRDDLNLYNDSHEYDNNEMYHDCFSTEENQINFYYQDNDVVNTNDNNINYQKQTLYDKEEKEKNEQQEVTEETNEKVIKSFILSCLPITTTSKTTQQNKRNYSKSTPSLSSLKENHSAATTTTAKFSFDFLQSCKSLNYLGHEERQHQSSYYTDDNGDDDDADDDSEGVNNNQYFFISNNNINSTIGYNNKLRKIRLPFTPMSYFPEDLAYTNEEILMEFSNEPTPESNLRPIITTSSTATTHHSQEGSSNADTSPTSTSSNTHNIAYNCRGRGSSTGSASTTKNASPKTYTTVQCRSFHIITSAALPWMTGTAVNPILRAVYINKMNREAVQNALKHNNRINNNATYEEEASSMMGTVTLCIPWLIDEKDRTLLYGPNYSSLLTTKDDQEQYIRKWIEQNAKLPLEAYRHTNGIHIKFYDAKYSTEFMSILPIGDIREAIHLELVNDVNADVCILEEPEHLTITLSPSYPPYNQTFRHVVGIMHTNYEKYVLNAHVSGVVLAPVIAFFSACLARVHCDKIVKLSDTLQSYAVEKECVNNVHGIRSDFVEEGKRRAATMMISSLSTSEKESNKENDEEITMAENKIYFIGKLLWVKGLDKLIELENAFKKSTGNYFPIEIVGTGPEADVIQRAFLGRSGNNLTTKRQRQQQQQQQQLFSSQGSLSKLMNEIPKSRHEFRKDSIPATFTGRMDHAQLTNDYKIFVNPSVSEVLCTTTAEAIAMGKFAIIPKHPSNTFFEQFPNCLMYERKEEFISRLQYAISNEPTPLSVEHQYILTWEAATERVIEASIVTKRDERRRIRLGQRKVDERVSEVLKGSLFNALQRFVFSSIGMETNITDKVKEIQKENKIHYNRRSLQVESE